jgi:hypothetical protein
LLLCQTFGGLILCLRISIIVLHKWINAGPLMNMKDLTSYHDYCAGIAIFLCWMICAYPFVFVELHMLLINMLVELSYDFKGNGIIDVCAI